MLTFYHGCWLAIFGHLAHEIQKSTMTLATFLNSCTPQMMEEIFNQLPGTTVPVTVLVQTLAEFATSYGMCSPFVNLGVVSSNFGQVEQ
jgi:choline-glycine betaine transporter